MVWMRSRATCSWWRWWSTAGSCTAKAASWASAVSAVEEAAHELGLLSEVLVRMEREQFRSPLLAGLRASLDAEGEPPSRQLARLKRLVENLDSRDNVVVRVLEPFILWTPHLAVQRGRLARAIGHGRAPLAACGGRDGGAVLAGQPRLRTSGRPVSRIRGRGGPCIEAEAIGHPLLPEDKVVRNDIRLGGALQVHRGQRVQHVGQEHHAAHPGRQCGAGAGRRPGARAAAAAVAAGGGRIHPR